MNILYIGQYTTGTTSKMRADQLKEIIQTSSLGNREVNFNVIDTHIPFNNTARIWRSLGFRYKCGPLIKTINRYIKNQLSESSIKLDLIWVDKAIFITPCTTKLLRSLTTKLIHFTPDMAFYENKSNHFIKNISQYDYLITTKSIETKIYQQFIPKEKLLLTTQGFDKDIHKPLHTFSQKEDCIAFIGLCEPSRETIVQQLIDNKIKVKIAGKGWNSFVKKNVENPYLQFQGDGLFGNAYSQFISSSLFSIGFLSKKFEELHTTRTFEIPACGTALITECNDEIANFYKADEVIFYKSVNDMIKKIKYYQAHLNQLELLTKKGTQRVHQDGRDYESILREILIQIQIA
ncbi:glycosyltransferase family protein [Saccharicrinis aurantiacus]|uniref:glycosyltransferase family protein n=1 Tax=Saccharicrinis aurantiacus TaxID=1849719 RepID=UPI0009F870F7|nr:glycosyltransferase [Saccharicrinis aurantiacus]